MSGPENRSEQNDAEKNAEGLRKLAEALGQKPELQNNFANQVISTPVAQRAENYKNTAHGTPGMISTGPQITDPYERANLAPRSPTTTSEQAARNVANHQDPTFRLNELRGKTNPNSMAAIENAISSVQDQLQKPNPSLRDLAIAVNKGISVPSDFPIQIPLNCKIPALQAYRGKTVGFDQIRKVS